MYGALRHLSVDENLLYRLHSALEEVHVQVLKASTGDLRGEINALKETINLDVSLGRSRESALCALACGTQAALGALVARHVLLVLLLELLHKKVNKTVVKVLTTQVSVTCGGLDLKDTLLDGQKRNIKGSSTKIKDENVALSLLLVETVGNSSSGRLVDDAEYVKSSNNTSILGCLTLRVVEVSRYGNYSVLHLLAKVGLSYLLHLDKNHR
mmetsp:Transcript_13399/g.23835  ORF Transcript_13399/g.23835 Transcript_13399/m.23835 type:complete len:212 (+) Transcript_13399:1102-1737(+)